MMMPAAVMGTCRETVQNISDYIDGRTPLPQRWRISFHLMLCPACKRWFRRLRETFKGVDLLRRAEMDHHIPPALKEKIERIFGS